MCIIRDCVLLDYPDRPAVEEEGAACSLCMIRSLADIQDIYLSSQLAIYISRHLSFFPSFLPSFIPSFFPSCVPYFSYLSTYLAIFLAIYLSIYISIQLSQQLAFFLLTSFPQLVHVCRPLYLITIFHHFFIFFLFSLSLLLMFLFLFHVLGV